MTHFGRAGNEVNGLSKGTYPANCEVLLSGQDRRAGGRREYFLIRAEGTLLWLRICTAMPGCGYDEFAVIHEVAVTEQEQQDLQAHAAKSIEILCEPRVVN